MGIDSIRGRVINSLKSMINPIPKLQSICNLESVARTNSIPNLQSVGFPVADSVNATANMRKLAGDLVHTNKNNNLMLIVQHAFKGTRDYSVISMEEEKSFRLVRDNLPNFSRLRVQNYCPIQQDADIRILSCCNAWMLLEQGKGFNTVKSMWNPTTDMTINLPHFVPQVYELPLMELCSGIGHDTASGDYKVVNVLGSDFFSEDGFPRIHWQVFSPATGSWKVVPFPHRLHRFFGVSHLHISGLFYWLITETYDTCAIISFDLSNEKFGPTLIPMPMCDKRPTMYHNVVLAEVHGSLATVFFDFYDVLKNEALVKEVGKESCFSITDAFENQGKKMMERPFPIEIWVWNEGGKWCRTWAVDLPAAASVKRVVGLYNNDKLLLIDHEKELLLYDCETSEMHKLGIRADYSNIVVYPYLKSPVPC